MHLAVVDPEVGGERRAVALRTAEEDRILVGPDNGLLLPAAERFGGVVEAVEISRSQHRLEPTAATFHGRDVFAPVAAQLAGGAPLAEAGDPLEADKLVALEMPESRVEDGAGRRPRPRVRPLRQRDARRRARRGRRATACASATRSSVNDEARRTTPRRSPTSRPGELLLYEDAYRWLALAVNRGSAADLLGLRLDDEVRIKPADE